VSNGKVDKPKRDFGGNNTNFGGNNPNDKPIPDVIESCTIFVGNLSFGSTTDSLSEFFKHCGDIK
jgi:RNA recognition motif-containing protein